MVQSSKLHPDFSKIQRFLFWDTNFDEIDWTQALPEERATLELLRQHGAKMSKELAA